MNKFRKVGVLTSGGDAPGMNACIRAVVRTLIYNDILVVGFEDGYEGMISDRYRNLLYSDVSGIIQKGGTILGSARCKEFFTEEGRKKAYDNLVNNQVDALIVIGGDGTFTGAKIFGQQFNYPVMGLPGTIDNDLYGTDFTIGFDTALNTIVENVDKIRDTASSHHRLFLVEVMGRDAGFLALHAGLSVGAEDILIPEMKTSLADTITKLKKSEHTKKSSIIIIAEGDDAGGAFEVAKQLKPELPWLDMRVSILGHIQRGGSPSAKDRIIATILGSECVNFLLDGSAGFMVGIQNRKATLVTFDKAIKHHNSPDMTKMSYLKTLSAL
jgi:6-phosphofructokinase 1